MSSLKPVIAALQRGDARAALLALLDVWSHTPAVELEALIDDVGRAAAPVAAPFDTERGWVSAAEMRDPAMVPWLVASLSPRHLETLAAFPPDPRLWATAATLLDARRLTEANRLKWLSPLLELLHRSKSPRSREVVERLSSDFIALSAPRATQSLVADALTRLPLVSPTAALDAGELEAANEALRRLLGEGQRRSLDDLFDAVYRDPEADEPRLVLADALMESGDPRGEFIALQLNENTRLGRRVAELQEQLRDEWLRPFSAFMPPGMVDFTRGFPESAVFTAPPLKANRALRTLREVSVDGQHGAFLAGPDFAQLRSVRAPAVAALEALRIAPLGWQALKVNVQSEAEGRELIELLRAGRLAQLQSLQVDCPVPSLAGQLVVLAVAQRVTLELICREASFSASYSDGRLTLSGKRRIEQADIADALDALPERGLQWLTFAIFGGAGPFERLRSKAEQFETAAVRG